MTAGPAVTGARPESPPPVEASTRLPLGLDDPVSRLPGLWSAHAKALARMDVATVGDLLRLAPRRFEDRREVRPIASLADLLRSGGATGEVAVVGTVVSSRLVRARRGLSIVEARVSDETGVVEARWFRQPYLLKVLAPGTRVALFGAPKEGRLSSPSVERVPDDGSEHPGLSRLVPVHPLTRGISAQGMRKTVWTALRAVGPVEDPLPSSCVASARLPPLPHALRSLHFPDDLEAAEAARRRFAFDELFLHEVLLARRRRARESVPARALRWTPALDRRIRGRLPFEPTPAQEAAIAEIVADLGRDVPMNRLLQGDVGAGKTAVAAYACLVCVANRRQAAFMAPTEILARQHEATLRAILRGSRVRVAALHGSMRPKERRETLARVAAGDVDLVVGTHAVVSRGVAFDSLALAVVDEQHKFGVRQRRELVTKGPAPHCLVMTATPIPRTLAMVVYGDLDVSVMRGRPPGRGPCETWVARPSDGPAVFERVRAELDGGRQAFVVYPLVEESDRVGLRDATEGRERWARAMPGRRVGLVHGKLPAEERTRAMEDFRRRRTDVLVSTVVIEVGVDVPNATVLVVEHAERFGLSQLHQLRGRVGRGPGGGLCVLVDRASGGTPDRLRVLASTEDGFEIAEEDLRLRGAGDLLGTRQHGAPAFSAARLPDDLDLLLAARREVSDLLARDPRLEAPDAARLRAAVEGREAALGDPTRGG